MTLPTVMRLFRRLMSSLKWPSHRKVEMYIRGQLIISPLELRLKNVPPPITILDSSSQQSSKLNCCTSRAVGWHIMKLMIIQVTSSGRARHLRLSVLTTSGSGLLTCMACQDSVRLVCNSCHDNIYPCSTCIIAWLVNNVKHAQSLQ